MTDNTKQPVFVLLDLDDTILDFHKAEDAAIRKTFAQLGLEATDSLVQRYSRINQLQWERLELGEIDRRQVLTGRFEILFAEQGIDLDGDKAQELYEHLLSIGHWFMPGAEELLIELFGKYRLYIVSNGTAAVQQGRLESSGIGKYFDGIFISERIGYNKPSNKFFEVCFERIPDFDRSRAIIVGDSLSSDIRGGVNAGLKTCWYNPKLKTPGIDVTADYEISHLLQLPELLSSLW